MEKLVYFFLPDQYAGWESAYLSSALAAFGHMVRTASFNKDPIRSIGGFTLLPDSALEDVPAELDGLVLIGGRSWRGEKARQAEPLVRRVLDQGGVLGAICDAAAFLGTIGLLNSGLHTCNSLAGLETWAGDRYSNGAQFLPHQAVRDGKLVTANGSAALEFAREFLLALEAAPERDILDWYLFHKLGFYTAPLLGM